MHKAVFVTCYIVFVSFAFSKVLHLPESLKINQINKNKTFEKEEQLPVDHNKSNISIQNVKQLNKVINGTKDEIGSKTTKTPTKISKVEHNLQYHYKALESIPILKKIHARITRSKDAVWATITLTFICVLLVLAVAQSRMWKDHYYTESQGVPLPNFNERVLFKDVMERKIATMKKFFKKKESKEKDVTELESLLPPSEWD